MNVGKARSTRSMNFRQAPAVDHHCGDTVVHDSEPRRNSIQLEDRTSQQTSARRRSSKRMLSPEKLVAARQQPANLDGGNSPTEDPSPRNSNSSRTEARRNMAPNMRDGLRRVASTPEIPLKRKLSNPISTVTRRPEAARKMPVLMTRHPENIRQPTNQATIHPATALPSPNSASLGGSTSPTSILNSQWSPVEPQDGTGLTSLGSDRISSRPTAVNDAKDYRETPSFREVHFDLPPIREVPTPQGSVRGIPGSPMALHATIDACKEQLITSTALAEQCASTKIFFETLYHNIQSETRVASPRSMRRCQMEGTLDFMCSTMAQQDEMRARFNKLENEHLRTLRCMKARRNSLATGISLAGYEMVRVLGKGSFGIVSLVREKRQDTGWSRSRRGGGAVYAMKVIKKSEMLRQCQEAHLRIERDFMVKSADRSSWMVPLIASFQDIDHLYLVMEFQIGGDFLNLLMTANNGIITEDETRFYIAEIILCVEEAHNLKIIHRDIKPDNFLISSSGHLKLSDFGLAFDGHWSHKQSYFSGHRYAMMDKLDAKAEGDEEDRHLDSKYLPRPSLDGQFWHTSAPSAQCKEYDTRFNRRRMARSIVGTSQYMAPEVIAGEHYDGRCDWWSVGIILFECLFGFTPFVRDDRQQTKQAISNWQTEFPEAIFQAGPQRVSHQVENLIYCLLRGREHRLCSQKYRGNDYKLVTREGFCCVTDADRGCHDFAGRYVHSNDAELLKQHPFFEGISWRGLHHVKPPFKPSCRQDDSCKYFDTEEEILKDYMSDTGSGGGVPTQQELNWDGMDGENRRKQPKQPPKRARCKMLRDPVVGRTVMQERKKSAFLGYTYRRPKTWSLGNELRLGGDLQMPQPGQANGALLPTPAMT